MCFNSNVPNPTDKFARRSNDNLLQLWRGRDKLKDEDIDPLREELAKRGLSKEAEKIAEQASNEDIYGVLPPTPQTYLNFSVAFWWLRELWLRHKTKSGTHVEATIESAYRTRSRYYSAARASLLYSYEFQGRQYQGKIVRDFIFGSAAADALAFDHHPGEKLPIVISHHQPQLSYHPSGFGSVQPIIAGVQSLFALAIVLGIARLVIWSVLRQI